MQQMLRPLRATKVAAVIGPGTQPFPWIDIRDLCRAMSFFIENEELRGVFNLVAPQAVSQSTFTRAMGKAYHAWTTLIVPQAVFRLLYGCLLNTSGIVRFCSDNRVIEEEGKSS